MSTQPDSAPAATAEAPDKGVGFDALLATPWWEKYGFANEPMEPEYVIARAAWRDPFLDWAKTRGVWPRLTHEEIFTAGWDAAIRAAESDTAELRRRYDEACKCADRLADTLLANNRGEPRSPEQK